MRIRLDYLERIEEGDYTVTPLPFLRAFLREYAEVVGVDPQLVMQKFDKKIDTIITEDTLKPPKTAEPPLRSAAADVKIITPEKSVEPEGETVGVAQRANAERTPALASLDLLLQWEVDAFGGKLGGYVQVKNVRSRTNPASYLGSEWSCVHGGDPSGCPGQEVLVDRFEDGIMTLPFIGFWIRF